MAIISESSSAAAAAAPGGARAPDTLARSLNVRDVVMITVSGVTPASSIFVIAPFAIQQRAAAR